MPLIEIPHVPDSLNDWSRNGGHWSIRTDARDRWRRYFFAYGAKRAAKLTGPVEVWVTFWMPTRRRADPDNRLKFVLDAAVHHGLIPDDGPPLLTWLHVAARYDPDRPRTVFRYEIADAPAWEAGNPRRRRGQRPVRPVLALPEGSAP